MHRRPQFEPLARLAAAGCGLFGPWVLRGWNYHARCSRLGPSSCVGAFVLPGAAAAAMPPVRSWGGCAAWVWAGCVARRLAWALLSCRVPLRRLCRRDALEEAVPLGVGPGAWPVVLRGRFCPAGCCCGGFAAGTLLAWLCRLGLGRVRGPSSRVGASVLMGAAAAAMPPVRFWVGCALIIWGSIVRHPPICCGCMGHCRPLFPL